jgi:hypothetical protein
MSVNDCVGQPLRPDGRTGRSTFSFNLIQHCPPILRRQLVGRADGPQRRRHVSARGSRNGLFLHLFSGRHAPALAGRSVMAYLEHTKNKC